MRNSLPSLEGGGVQARIAGARGTLADHEPFAVAHREPCVIRRRSWIFARRVVHCFLGAFTEWWWSDYLQLLSRHSRSWIDRDRSEVCAVRKCLRLRLGNLRRTSDVCWERSVRLQRWNVAQRWIVKQLASREGRNSAADQRMRPCNAFGRR